MLYTTEYIMRIRSTLSTLTSPILLYALTVSQTQFLLWNRTLQTVYTLCAFIPCFDVYAKWTRTWMRTEHRTTRDTYCTDLPWQRITIKYLRCLNGKVCAYIRNSVRHSRTRSLWTPRIRTWGRFRSQRATGLFKLKLTLSKLSNCFFRIKYCHLNLEECLPDTNTRFGYGIHVYVCNTDPSSEPDDHWVVLHATEGV